MIDLLAYGAFFATTALVFAVASLGLNIQWGQAGLFNVGIAGFVAIGAYASALLTSAPAAGRLGGFDLPIILGWLGAAIIGATVAVGIGALTLRLRADYLGITTFGVAVAVHLVAVNAQSITGGPFGIGFIPRPFVSLIGDPVRFNLANLALAGAVAGLLYAVLERLVRSPWGRALRALREDERAAVSLGKSARLFRLQAFGVGGAAMALAGAMQAHFTGFIAPDNYLPTLTFQVWAMLIVGGSGSNKGAVLGAGFVWLVWTGSGALMAALFSPENQARGASLQIVAVGVMLCLVLVVRPNGLVRSGPVDAARSRRNP